MYLCLPRYWMPCCAHSDLSLIFPFWKYISCSQNLVQTFSLKKNRYRFLILTNWQILGFSRDLSCLLKNARIINFVDTFLLKFLKRFNLKCQKVLIFQMRFLDYNSMWQSLFLLFTVDQVLDRESILHFWYVMIGNFDIHSYFNATSFGPSHYFWNMGLGNLLAGRIAEWT